MRVSYLDAAIPATDMIKDDRSTLDAKFVGRIIGLAQAAEELRHIQTDKHFVDTLIRYAHEYCAKTGFPVPDAIGGLKATQTADPPGSK